MQYEMSEQLFLDVWDEYGRPDEITDKALINGFLEEIVERSKTLVVLDHYSEINFDCVSQIQTVGDYTLIHWYNHDNLRMRFLDKGLGGMDLLRWEMSDYITCKYLLLDISKLKFVLAHSHLFALVQSALIQPSTIKKYYLSSNDELIEEENETNNLYTRYTFLRGDPAELNKHVCLVSNLPYYTCVIQPKENIPPTWVSKELLLAANCIDAMNRMKRTKQRIDTADNDIDFLLGIGNSIRSILEYTMKYYCVIKGYELQSIEQKYGYFSLGDVKKVIGLNDNICISQKLIITANEFSHDSGKVITKAQLYDFYSEANDLVNSLMQQLQFPARKAAENK